MHRSIITITISALVLTGCGTNKDEGDILIQKVSSPPGAESSMPMTSSIPTKAPNSLNTFQIDSTVEDPSSPPDRYLAKEGEMCGGIAGILCEGGLECKYNEDGIPDGSGICE